MDTKLLMSPVAYPEAHGAGMEASFAAVECPLTHLDLIVDERNLLHYKHY
jgi:hypothetical protein